jgi:hypothetical protein
VAEHTSDPIDVTVQWPEGKSSTVRISPRKVQGSAIEVTQLDEELKMSGGLQDLGLEVRPTDLVDPSTLRRAVVDWARAVPRGGQIRVSCDELRFLVVGRFLDPTNARAIVIVVGTDGSVD